MARRLSRRTLLAAPAASAAPAIPRAQGAIDIMVHYPQLYAFKAWFDAIEAAFARIDPSVRIVFHTSPNYAEGAQQVLQQAITGQRPDLSFQSFNLLRMFAERGIARDFSPLLMRDGDPATAGYTPELLALARFAGIQAGLAYAASNAICYLNADLLRRLGLEPEALPEDWDGHLILAARVAERLPGVDGMWFAHSEWMFQTLLYGFGGRMMREDESDIAFDGAEGLAALRLLARMTAEARMPPLNPNAAVQALAAGRSAIHYRSAVVLQNIVQAVGRSFDLRTALWPVVPGRTRRRAIGSAAGMLTPRDPVRQEAAWRFLRFATKPGGAGADGHGKWLCTLQPACHRLSALAGGILSRQAVVPSSALRKYQQLSLGLLFPARRQRRSQPRSAGISNAPCSATPTRPASLPRWPPPPAVARMRSKPEMSEMAKAAPLQILHLSDPHLVPPGQLLYGLDPYDRLRRVLDAIAARHAPGAPEQASLLVLSGDLAHQGEEEAYRALAELLRSFPLPVALMIGNHDDRAAFLRVFADVPRDDAGFVQQVVDLGLLRLLLLDTVAVGRPHGELCETRLAWLSDRLAEDDRPVLLALHHPPFPTGLQRMDCLALAKPEALWETISPHCRKIRHLLCGHLHRSIGGAWRGISFSIPRSTAHQVAFDLARSWRLPVLGSHEPPGYVLLRLASDSVVVHHVDALDESARFDLSPIVIAEGQEPPWIFDLCPDLVARRPLPSSEEQETTR